MDHFPEATRPSQPRRFKFPICVGEDFKLKLNQSDVPIPIYGGFHNYCHTMLIETEC